MQLNIVNYDKYPIIDQILYENESYINNIKKIYIYNPIIENAMHSFWYYIDKCKLISKKNTTLSIALPNNDKLINSIKSLDKKINDLLNENNECNIDNSIIIRTNSPTYMKINIDSNTVFFSSNNEIIESKLLENGCNLSILIELEYVLEIKNKDKKTLNKYWRIIQARKISTLNIKIPLFDKLTELTNKSIQQPIPPPIPPVQQQVQQPTKQTLHKFVPSVDELRDKLKNMKKKEI